MTKRTTSIPMRSNKISQSRTWFLASAAPWDLIVWAEGSTCSLIPPCPRHNEQKLSLKLSKKLLPLHMHINYLVDKAVHNYYQLEAFSFSTTSHDWFFQIYHIHPNREDTNLAGKIMVHSHKTQQLQCFWNRNSVT